VGQPSHRFWKNEVEEDILSNPPAIDEKYPWSPGDVALSEEYIWYRKQHNWCRYSREEIEVDGHRVSHPVKEELYLGVSYKDDDPLRPSPTWLYDEQHKQMVASTIPRRSTAASTDVPIGDKICKYFILIPLNHRIIAAMQRKTFQK
jgi:hypothetical protein